MRLSHIYVEYRSSGRQVERFWECMACGHQRPVLEEIREPRVDPETERLHAQWREDNEEF